MSILSAIDAFEELISEKLRVLTPFRAVVVAVSGGLVTITRENADSSDGMAYAHLAGFLLTAGDVVACLNYNGQPIILGKIRNSAPGAVSVEAGLIGEVVQAHVSQDAADNPSTTNTSTYQVLCTTAITLPAGTWTARAALDARATHGVGGNVSLKINVGGTASGATWTGGSTSAARTLAASATAPGSWVGTSTALAGIAGGGSVNVFGGYVSSGGNTATATGPRMLIDFTRTA